MNHFKITFENGDYFTTGFNGNLNDALNYYLNNYFNLGRVKDNMQKAIKVQEVQ